jgi:hypothetical protein
VDVKKDSMMKETLNFNVKSVDYSVKPVPIQKLVIPVSLNLIEH